MQANALSGVFEDRGKGQVPEEWKITKLGQIAELTMGQSPPSTTYNTEGFGLPFLQGKAEFGSVYPTPVKYCSAPQKKAQVNNILISVRAPVGDVNIAPYECVIGRGLAAIDGTEETHNPYLFYYLLWAKGRLAEKGTGSTFKSINKNTLQDFLVALPPLPEQKRIAHILSTIQQAIEAQDRVLNAAREFKRSLMQRLFTYGPYEAGCPTRETDIGEIPEHWEVSPLGPLVNVKGGKRLPKGVPYEARITEHPYIRVVDFKGNSIDKSDLKYISSEVHQQIGRYIITSDDVYISIAGTTGIVGTVPEELSGANLTENAARLVLRDKSKLRKDFLMWSLHSTLGQTQIQRRTTKTSQPKLALSRIKQIPIPLPPVEEQEIIAAMLGCANLKVIVETNRRNSLEFLLKSMLHNLMNGQIRVNETEVAL